MVVVASKHALGQGIHALCLQEWRASANRCRRPLCRLCIGRGRGGMGEEQRTLADRHTWRRRHCRKSDALVSNKTEGHQDYRLFVLAVGARHRGGPHPQSPTQTERQWQKVSFSSGSTTTCGALPDFLFPRPFCESASSLFSLFPEFLFPARSDGTTQKRPSAHEPDPCFFFAPPPSAVAHPLLPSFVASQKKGAKTLFSKATTRGSPARSAAPRFFGQNAKTWIYLGTGKGALCVRPSFFGSFLSRKTNPP